MAVKTRSEIERVAGDLIADHLGEPVPPVDVETLVERLGGRLEVRFQPYLDPESLEVAENDIFTIVVPPHTSRARDRFTIAHELGHFMLHYDRGSGPAKFLRYGQNDQETEANAFAGALLMPEASFRDVWKGCDGDLRRLARSFDVSQTAASVRAKVLRLS